MHARFFRDGDGIRAHMEKHAQIIRPKFEAAYHLLSKELDGCQIASWTKAEGGYFFSFNTMDHCAVEIVKMCGDYGVKFTPAGSTHPYGRDEDDNDIRIAPTFATLEEIETAIVVLALCTKIVSINKLASAIQ